MRKIDKLKPGTIFLIYLILDIICVGMGMGVPIFCILLGLPVGWLFVKYIDAKGLSIAGVHKTALRYSILAVLITLIGMLLLWGPTIRMLFMAEADLANFGIPMILYEPRISFIGWLILMILISPFLQLLTMIFGAYLAIMGWLGRSEVSIQAELQTPML